MAKKRTKYECVFVDTYRLSDRFDYEGYKEWCESNEREPKSEDSDDYQDYIRRESDFEISEFDHNMEKYLKDHTLIAYGSSQRWDSTTYGGYLVRNLGDFYRMNKDVDNYKMWQDSKGFHLQMSHHDGTLYITMRLLTNKGLKYIENCERNGKSPSLRSLNESPYSKSLRCIKGKEETYLF